ncbi:DUF523 domain-containing protein [Isobaculum melis]|uniref:Uncharacterized conserved protein YbbK, DUF523 family n=1 Tax=Isobaculum melis TaxID=142588 RepID=A0A1H9R1L8_9LACT|nr:DUF523 domain-containing protein [Isobaculum melis]SER66721.1 Uncharacterized conserved protein YbbK, DUF523 family [Isobaculum melis]
MIGVSACLAGCPCRYDGQANTVEEIKRLIQNEQAVAFCPEVLGGLATPREPAEIVGGSAEDVWNGSAKVLTISGKDVTEAFKNGALATLAALKKHGIKTVILKANSPSCGSEMVYDGTFSGHKIIGNGLTAALLKKHQIIVTDEYHWNA